MPMTIGSGGFTGQLRRVKDPKVLSTEGQMPEGPPLLKERRYLRKDAGAVVEVPRRRV